MIYGRPPRRPPPTREELEALQREREARIAEASQFPWTRLLVAAVAAVLTIVFTGGGIASLILATFVVTVILARAFRRRKTRG